MGKCQWLLLNICLLTKTKIIDAKAFVGPRVLLALWDFTLCSILQSKSLRRLSYKSTTRPWRKGPWILALLIRATWTWINFLTSFSIRVNLILNTVGYDCWFPNFHIFKNIHLFLNENFSPIFILYGCDPVSQSRVLILYSWQSLKPALKAKISVKHFWNQWNDNFITSSCRICHLSPSMQVLLVGLLLFALTGVWLVRFQSKWKLSYDIIFEFVVN